MLPKRRSDKDTGLTRWEILSRTEKNVIETTKIGRNKRLTILFGVEGREVIGPMNCWI
jgi:hypothetical protein